jgi:hypothetical protein
MPRRSRQGKWIDVREAGKPWLKTGCWETKRIETDYFSFTVTSGFTSTLTPSIPLRASIAAAGSF